MSTLNARYNSKTKQYRCGLTDCNALLAVGEEVKDKLEIKCKCGAMNNIAVNTQHKPEGRLNDKQPRKRKRFAKG